MQIIILTLILAVVVNAKEGNFIHLTDIHYDQYYQPGAPTRCQFGYTGMGCCRALSIPRHPRGNASKWGDFNCDSPFLLVNETVEWIRNNLKYDFVVYTGDSVSHWDVTQDWSRNFEAVKTVSRLLARLGKPVIHVLGNHDSWFVDQLYLNYPTIGDIYHLWTSENLTGGVDLSNFTQGGYYQTRLDNTRICVLNSLWYDRHNLPVYLWPDGDLGGQYAWSREHLDGCFTLGHISPTASEASDVFDAFMRTVNPSVQLYGHSHRDQFVVTTPRGGPMQVAFVAPSVVPSGGFPGFRQFQYRTVGSTVELLDYRQYRLNLTRQLLQDNFIGYESEYSAKASYDLPDLSAASMFVFAHRMQHNQTLFERYCRHYHPPAEVCNRRALLCEIHPIFC